MRLLIGSLLSAVFLAGTVTTTAEEALRDDPETRCQNYAQEDDVPSEELAAYVEDCLANPEIDPALGVLPAADDLEPDEVVVQ